MCIRDSCRLRHPHAGLLGPGVEMLRDPDLLLGHALGVAVVKADDRPLVVPVQRRPAVADVLVRLHATVLAKFVPAALVVRPLPPRPPVVAVVKNQLGGRLPNRGEFVPGMILRGQRPPSSV